MPEDILREKIEFTTCKYDVAKAISDSLEEGITKPRVVFRPCEMPTNEIKPISYCDMCSAFQRNSASIIVEILDYVAERKWHCYDQPRNLVLAILNEISELLQLFVWRNDLPGELLCDSVRMEAAYELADTLIFAMRFGFYMGFSVVGISMDESILPLV